MKKVQEQTEKILYTGNNHNLIHQHFKKWESEWNFTTKLYTHHYNSYEQTMKGDVRADLLIKENNGDRPTIIPFNRLLSFIRVDSEIMINIETIA